MREIEEIIEAKKKGLEFPRKSLIDSIRTKKPAMIAEVKRASPSQGAIRQADPVEVARIYDQAQVAGISVLTEETRFDGRLEDLTRVKDSVTAPVLRKDFIIDELQVYESLLAGADAILLITAILREKTKRFVELTHSLGMQCIVEVHNTEELGYALYSGAKLIGINNRDLNTLYVDLRTTEELAEKIPSDRIIIAESGMSSRQDVLRMYEAGASAVLVGSSIMKSKDIAGKLRELMGG